MRGFDLHFKLSFTALWLSGRFKLPYHHFQCFIIALTLDFPMLYCDIVLSDYAKAYGTTQWDCATMMSPRNQSGINCLDLVISGG